MRVPSSGCCVSSPAHEELPVSKPALLAIISIFGAIGFFGFAVAFLHV